MPMVGLLEASRLTGRSPSTITRAVNKGKLSCQQDQATGTRTFDPAELQRWCGALNAPARDDARAPSGTSAGSAESSNGDSATVRELRTALEHVHSRELGRLEEMVRDLREDRDHWRAQAEQAQRLLAAPERAASSTAPVPKAGVLAWFRRMLGD